MDRLDYLTLQRSLLMAQVSEIDKQLALDPPTPEPSPPVPPPAPEPSVHSQFGFNVGHVSYWSTSQIFSNQFFRSVLQAPDKSELQFGYYGELLSEKQADCYWIVNNIHLKRGTYEFLTFGETHQHVESQLVWSQERTYKLSTQGPWDYFLLCHEDDVNILVPSFAERGRQAGCVRWMNALDVNNQYYDLASPSIVRLANNRYSRRVSYDMISMAHEELGGAPCWLNLHLKMTESQVRDAASVLRDSDVDFLVYVETGNEMWNPAFGGQALFVPEGSGAWVEPYAALCQRNAKVFKDVLGDRARCVMASQAVNSWISDKLMSFVEPGVFDCLAIAPYFSPRQPLRDPTWCQNTTEAEVLDLCLEAVRGSVSTAVLQSKAVADKYGVELVAYEGGSHLSPSDNRFDQKFIAISQSPGMADVYREYIDMWRTHCGDSLFNFYRDTGDDCWGHKQSEYVTSPRWQVVQEAMASHTDA